MSADLKQIEDMLRSAFADAAATARQDKLRRDVPIPAERVRWSAGIRSRRLAIPIAAAVAVVAVVIIAAVVPRALHSGSRGPAPTAGAIGPAVYVATTSGTVVPVGLATGRPLRPAIRLPGRGQVQDMEIAANGKIICVLSQVPRKAAYLTRIDTATGTAAEPIATPYGTALVTVSPNGRTAYLYEQPGPGQPGGVVPVNLVTGTVHQQITVRGAYAMALSPDGRTLYVSATPRETPGANNGQQVVPIDTATSTALAPIKLRAPGFAEGIAVAPNGKTVYVATLASGPNVSTAEVTPISTATDIAMKPIVVRQPFPAAPSIAIAPDGRTAYVSGGARYVSPIDLATNTALKPIKLPSSRSGYHFQISPDGRAGYAYGETPAVIPVNLATNTPLAPITVARPPYLAISTLGPIGIGAKALYIGVDYYDDFVQGRGAIFHAALSRVELATGKVSYLKVGGVPQFVVVAP